MAVQPQEGTCGHIQLQKWPERSFQLTYYIFFIALLFSSLLSAALVKSILRPVGAVGQWGVGGRWKTMKRYFSKAPSLWFYLGNEKKLACISVLSWHVALCSTTSDRWQITCSENLSCHTFWYRAGPGHAGLSYPGFVSNIDQRSQQPCWAWAQPTAWQSCEYWKSGSHQNWSTCTATSTVWRLGGHQEVRVISWLEWIKGSASLTKCINHKKVLSVKPESFPTLPSFSLSWEWKEVTGHSLQIVFCFILN